MKATTPAELAKLARLKVRCESGDAAEILDAAGTSAAAAGRACGTTHASILRWLKGDRRPTGEAAIRFAELLDRLEDAMRDGGRAA